MHKQTDKIHVTPLGQHWEIEAQSGKPLAHEDDKCEAVKTARALAQEQGIETVIVHEGDGIIEQVPDASVEARPTFNRRLRFFKKFDANHLTTEDSLGPVPSGKPKTHGQA